MSIRAHISRQLLLNENTTWEKKSLNESYSGWLTNTEQHGLQDLKKNHLRLNKTLRFMETKKNRKKLKRICPMGTISSLYLESAQMNSSKVCSGVSELQQL